MAKQRTLFESIKFYKDRIGRAKSACRKIEKLLPAAQQAFDNAQKYENSENSEERKIYLDAFTELTFLRADLTKYKSCIISDNEDLIKLEELKAKIEAGWAKNE